MMSDKDYLPKTWRDPRQELRASSVQGVGAFARQPIKAGEAVEIIGGVVMTDDEFKVFAHNAERYNAVQIAEGLHLVEELDVTQQREGGSLNHSCDSNLWMADEVTLVARHNIAAGDELTVDYALFTVLGDWHLELPCRCGAVDCRHTITGNDWQISAVQERYYPHFSPFINARIERIREGKR